MVAIKSKIGNLSFRGKRPKIIKSLSLTVQITLRSKMNQLLDEDEMKSEYKPNVCLFISGKSSDWWIWPNMGMPS